MSFYNNEGSLTSIFLTLGLRERKPAFEGSKTERWEIHKYQKWIITVLAKNSIASNILVTSHNAKDERNSYLLGFRAKGRQPTCKAEDRRSTSRKFDWHTFCQRHYFADMSQYWDMSDPHFWGFGMTGACTEGERFKARKLDSHTLAIETCNILGRCHNAEGYQAYIICESSCQGKGRLLFEVPRLGAHN